MVGGDLLLVFGDDLAGAARAANDAVRGLLQGVRGDHVAADAGGQQRGLVEHVGQISAGHAGGALGQGVERDVVGQRLVLGVHLEDLGAACDVRVGHRDLAVEAAGAQQRRVQDVRAVRRRDQDDAFAAGEAVHFHQQLVEGLFALVVASAHAGAALASHRVDLVDEDDARAVLAGLLE